MLRRHSPRNVMKRVGVFSGTFDPFHIAHLEACLVALAACQLDTVAIFVEKKPKRKKDITDYKKRLNMIDLATAEFPSLRMLDNEAENVTVKNTLPVLKRQFNKSEFWYILGSDILEHLESWDNLEDLFKNFKLCVILRSNSDRKKIESLLAHLSKKFEHLKYVVLPEVLSPVSSSTIKKEIKETGFSPYLHRDVLGYILKQDIY